MICTTCRDRGWVPWDDIRGIATTNCPDCRPMSVEPQPQEDDADLIERFYPWINRNFPDLAAIDRMMLVQALVRDKPWR